MIGVKKEHLVKSLCRISTSRCGYIGKHCDCKYMSKDHSTDHWGSEATGCPETLMAATLINSMTTQEFYAIARRAGISIGVVDDPWLNINDVVAQNANSTRCQTNRNIGDAHGCAQQKKVRQK